MYVNQTAQPAFCTERDAATASSPSPSSGGSTGAADSSAAGGAAAAQLEGPRAACLPPVRALVRVSIAATRVSAWRFADAFADLAATVAQHAATSAWAVISAGVYPVAAAKAIALAVMTSSAGPGIATALMEAAAAEVPGSAAAAEVGVWTWIGSSGLAAGAAFVGACLTAKVGWG
jgi:hypothetical protein